MVQVGICTCTPEPIPQFTEDDAIFCWQIKEGRCKWVNEMQDAEKPHFSLHMYEGNPYKHKAESKKTTWCSVFLPTCPDEASRLMVVRSIQPRLASSLWFTSRNWTMARLAASGETNTQTHKHTVN